MDELQTTNNIAVSYDSLEKRLFGDEEVNSVSLRELYLDLGYTDANFTTWAKNNLVSKFKEHRDYERLFLEKESNQGGKEKVEYIVTLDVAKHLAMSSDKPKGFEIREYFIEVEKIARKEKQLTPLQLMEKANQILIKEAEEKVKIIARNSKIIKSLEIIEHSSHDTGTTMEIHEFCKIISDRQEGSNLGRTKCYNLLRIMKLVMLKSKKPTQSGITRGYLSYVRHSKGEGYMTVIYRDKANKLIKLMVKYLQENPDVNEALGYPFHPELRE